MRNGVFARALPAASKDELACCARLLALGRARYRAAYGDLPEVESLTPKESETRALVEGMKNLVSPPA